MSVSGHIDVDGRGGRFFRPAVPRIPAIADIGDLLEKAKEALGRFDLLLASQHQNGAAARLFASLDAVQSSAAEGLSTTFTELMEFEASGRGTEPGGAATVAACSKCFELEESDPCKLALKMPVQCVPRWHACRKSRGVEDGSERYASPFMSGRLLLLHGS
jgi:hypothetical protein